MAAQKKRVATSKKVAAKKVSSKKVAAQSRRTTSVDTDTTIAELRSRDRPFNVHSKMTSKERLAIIVQSLERWESFIQLPVKQLTVGELEYIIESELERSPPRKSVVRRAKTAHGVIANKAELALLMDRVDVLVAESFE